MFRGGTLSWVLQKKHLDVSQFEGMSDSSADTSTLQSIIS